MGPPSYFVYIIQSRKDGSYYVGSTADVETRLLRHNEGWSRSTKAKVPWVVVHVEPFSSKTDALQREKEIKKMKSRSFIERLIRSHPVQHADETSS